MFPLIIASVWRVHSRIKRDRYCLLFSQPTGHVSAPQHIPYCLYIKEGICVCVSLCRAWASIILQSIET
jgi:hypothetical protein